MDTSFIGLLVVDVCLFITLFAITVRLRKVENMLKKLGEI
jgi:hypothetical protein